MAEQQNDSLGQFTGVGSEQVNGGTLFYGEKDTTTGKRQERFVPGLTPPPQVVSDTSGIRTDINEMNKLGTGIPGIGQKTDTFGVPWEYSIENPNRISPPGSVAGLTQEDYLKQIQDATKATTDEEKQIAEAGAAAGAAYEPLVAKAETAARQGKAATDIAAGERGGFMSTQFAGIAALKQTEGKTFAGAGGAIEEQYSAYDRDVQTLKQQQVAAISQAKAAERSAIISGKREDMKLANQMYQDAQNLQMKIEEAATKQNQYVLDAIKADRDYELNISKYNLEVDKYLSGEVRADSKDKIEKARLNIDIAKLTGEWMGAPTLEAKKQVADEAFKKLGLTLDQKKFEEMVRNNTFSNNIDQAKLDLEKSKFAAEQSGVDVNSYADKILGGTMNYDDVVKTIGKGSSQALNLALSNRKEALQSAYKETNNVSYLLKTSAGGKQVVSSDQQLLGKVFSVMTQLDQVKAAFDEASKNGKTGAFKGRITDKKFWDQDKAIIDAALAGVIPTVARGVFGEVGVLTDNDINNYKKAIADVKTPEDARDKIFNMLMTNVANKATETLRSNANAKYDVSGYAYDYENMANNVSRKTGTQLLKKSTNPAVYGNLNEFYANVDEKAQKSFEENAIKDMQAAGITDINDYFDFLKDASLNKDAYQGSFKQVGYDTKKVASAIGQFESGGNYKAIGPKTSSGDKAYGKYQVMGNNIPSWTKEALGKPMTPQQFLSDPKAQDKVAEYKMGQYLKKYGTIEDVASMWFSGRPMAKAGNAKDVIGTSVPQYIKNVKSIYNKLG